MDKTIGIVLRFADNLLAVKADTITEHNKIVAEHGKAYVGKMGKFIGKKALGICNDETVTRYLIFVKKGKAGYEFYQAKIESAQEEMPPSSLIPEYYRNSKVISSWICIKEKLKKLDDKKSKSWIIKSSGIEVAHTLGKSMAAYFIAVKKTIL